MDPTANLAEQVRLAKEIQKIVDGELPASVMETWQRTSRLSELVLALNEWMLKGGFPPRQWPEGTNARGFVQGRATN
jgi:hypothetical protein